MTASPDFSSSTLIEGGGIFGNREAAKGDAQYHRARAAARPGKGLRYTVAEIVELDGDE